MKRSTSLFLALTIALAVVPTAPAYAAPDANPTPVQTYFVPLPETQVRTFLETQNDVNGPMVSITSIVASANGTWIYYDQWEDGYEATLSQPGQTTTQIWGDGNCSNGYPPNKNGATVTLAQCQANPATVDFLKAGDVVILQNNIAYPRPATQTYVLDQFGSASYSNNNGNANWSGPWVESNDGGASQSPSAGRIQIISGQLRFTAANAGDTIDRGLPAGPDACTTLSFTLGQSGVQFDGTDRFAVQVSSDGGANYTTLATYGVTAEGVNPTPGTKHIGISNYVSGSTRVRFTTLDALEGNEYWSVDDVRVDWNCTQPITTYYDGRDKFGATSAVAVTRAMWDNTIGSVFASAVDVYDTSQYGTSFIMPAGENLPTSGTPAQGFDRDAFETSRLFVMAAQDNTSCTLARGANTLVTFSLSQGQSYYYHNSVNSGDKLTCTKPVQTDLASGDSITNPPYYEARWYSLPPTNQWSAGYYTPVGACSTSYPAIVFIHNPNSAAITVNWTNGTSNGSFSVAANTTYAYEITGTTVRGYYFYNTGGQPFLAVEAVNIPTGTSNSANYDWGFTLVSQDQASDEVLVGWGPGTRNLSANGSPIYVTAVDSGNTIIYVDYDGDPTTGPNTDPNGNKYDVSYTLAQYASQRIFDNNDNDQTRMHIYTTTGAKIVATYGEDSCTAGVADPYLDLGTAVRSLPSWLSSKSAVLYTDADGDGVPSPGDVLEFTIKVENRGGTNITNLNLTDSVPANTTYVSDSTDVSFDNSANWTNLGGGSLFPLASPGYNFPAPPNPNGAGVLKAHATYLIRFRVSATPSSPDVTEVCNTATLTGTAGEYKPSVCTPLYVMDWGDLPDSYGTTLAANGARHSKSTLWLGTYIDKELDGQPSVGANGDDTTMTTLPHADDEDGVAPVAWTSATSGNFGVKVTGGPGCLNAWMDFTNGSTVGGDGDFNDALGGKSEYIIQNVKLNTGTTTVPFTVPAGVLPPSGTSSYNFRFRLSPTDGGGNCTTTIAPTGFVSGGEVEDYRFTYSPFAITLASFMATNQATGVEVTWETVSELGNAGFNLYRDTSPDGPGARLNGELIPSQGPDSPSGFSYTYLDSAGLTPGTTYYYWLEDVNLDGVATRHEPVSILYTGPTAVVLREAHASSGLPSAAWLGGLGLAALAAVVLIRRRQGRQGRQRA